jgi:hypothetical protein
MTDQPPVAVLRADREVIERAAAALRAETIRQGYAGLQQPAVAFAFALLLDELSRRVCDLDDELRGSVVAACRGTHQDLRTRGVSQSGLHLVVGDIVGPQA